MKKPMTLEAAKKRIEQLEAFARTLGENVQEARKQRDEALTFLKQTRSDRQFLLDQLRTAHERVNELDAVIVAEMKRASDNERKYQTACGMIRVLLER